MLRKIAAPIYAASVVFASAAAMCACRPRIGRELEVVQLAQRALVPKTEASNEILRKRGYFNELPDRSGTKSIVRAD
ncbi:exported hypothetical protein [Bosea sp. EC-HK365B]|nr:exported hypothetical protein [Bosea sp. 7B]CAD5271605.1 exported hypothetical protein [Bosea sp. 21B]VVT56205.1 exported hypothetical protein [Bosea sp. EC-HK365B]VXC28885.1 exported hypothetical protein [Bosea sp. 127]